ncbi:uncharacterized protein [Coffea arabica]|uniref:Tf2-1-like SH3-like domain-containing protein n=1 Tax=Coffea arabica TaxID=13443 RepID=A0ABM4VU98_COFAR
MVVDTLSRLHGGDQDQTAQQGSCLALSIIKPLWIQELQESYDSDTHCQDIIAQLILDPASQPQYEWNNGLLRHNESLPNSQGYDTIMVVIDRLRWLALAEWWYNSSYHSSLQLTPFDALYGYKPTPLPLGPHLDSVIPAAAQLLQDRLRISNSIRDHLTKAQQRTKFFADQQRMERTFEVGDWVFLKLRPYKQQTVAIKKCLKLATRFCGPFQVEAKVELVAYHLKLPAGAKIHPVFHVSL